MAKITAHKQVYWDNGGKEKTGKVTQIMSDKAMIKGSDGTNYLLPKEALRTTKKDA